MTTGQKIATGVGVAAGAGLLIWGVPKIIALKNKSDAAGKLSLNFETASIYDANPTRIKIKVKFSAKNPSDQNLGYENLYIKLSIADSSGTFLKLADTIPDKTRTEIPALQTINTSQMAEVRLLDIIRIGGGIAKYFIKRLNGAKATRDAKVEYTYTSEGFNLSDSKIIKL